LAQRLYTGIIVGRDSGRRQLRSSVSGTLDSQRTKTVLGRRAFRVCGPATWNALSTELRTASVCPDTLGKKLKTCLFESSY